MLILSRKCNEAIVICEPGGLLSDCRITVLSVRGGRVRLGIEAGPDRSVRRAEVVARIRSAAQFQDAALETDMPSAALDNAARDLTSLPNAAESTPIQ